MNKYAAIPQSESKTNLALEILRFCKELNFKCKSHAQLVKMKHSRLVRKHSTLKTKLEEKKC